MLNIESYGRIIKIRGRRKNGDRYTQTDSFKPYFYIPKTRYDNAPHTALFGEKVSKKSFEHTSEIYNARKKFKRTWESDVRHTVKYMIDKYDEIPAEPIRTCFLDIETEDREGFPSPETAEKMISSICCYDNFKDKYFVFLTSPTGKDNTWKQTFDIDDGIESKIFEKATEREMLLKFADFIKKLDFDLIYAWNGDGFDYPYIFNRMKNLDIDIKDLSPFNKVVKCLTNKKDEKGKDIPLEKPSGRAWMDLLLTYKKLSTQEIESYSLDYVSEIELGNRKVVHSEKIGDMWENNIDKFLKYNIKDVVLMVGIEKRKGITDFLDNIRRTAFCDWYDTLYNPKILDCFMLKCAHDWNIILPARNFNIAEDAPVQGALVGVPTVGLTENVAVADVKSLYPSAIKTCNMSPETVVWSNEKKLISENKLKESNIEYCKVDDVIFRLDKRGFIPMVIEKIWDMRQEYKRKMKEFEYGSDEYNKYNILQTVSKFILNSIYGVMKFKSFRLYNRDTFKSVTAFGRANNLYMQEIVKRTGHQLVLYDTDSNDFKLNSTTYEDMIAEAKSVIDTMNNEWENWCIDTFGSAKYNCIEVEFEKIYGRLLTIKNEDGNEVKKRYAGSVIYDDGVDLREDPKIIIMGFAGKRSDTPPMFKNLQKDIFKMILNGNVENAIAKLKGIRKNIEKNIYSPEDIALPIGMSKPAYEYDRPSAAIRGVMFANQYCDENIIQEKVKYVYVKNKKYKPEIPRTDVISFTEKFPDWMEVDGEKMCERLIDKPYLNILFTLGYGISSLKGQTNLMDW